jgi:lysophospholipase L1-like esterase
VVGRADWSNPQAPRFEWSGVSIQARFTGTSVCVDMDGGNNQFEVIVDGQTQPKLLTSNGRRLMGLASGLADAQHDLTIWRRTEANDASPSQFYGLAIGGGSLISIQPPVHKLEVIGDSITCGYGNLGVGPNCGFTYDTEDNYLAYGSVAARELGADLYTECWSGKGIYRNIGGDMTETMPTLYERTIPTDSTSTWDNSYIPDAVIINLGTNDFHGGDPGSGYVTACENFVATLRARYPNAELVITIGPMLGGSQLTAARAYLDQVVQNRANLGDTRVQQFPLDPQDPVNGYGCDWHPSAKTHDIMGKALAAWLRTTLGW